MSAADEILADLPLDQLAAQLGTDPATAEQAVRTALPALFAGLQANVAGDAQGSVSLAQALTQHSDPQLLPGGVDLNDVDTNDGDAIVQHIFANSPDQAQALQASSSGAMSGVISKLLPILAPIVMAYIAKKLGMGNASQPGRQSSDDNGLGGLGGVLGPILGGLLGDGGATSGSGGGFGDILGQILAGQEPQAPVQQHDDGRFEQPTFNPPEGGDGQVTMPTAEDDSSGGQQQQKPSGGIGDILGGLFGR